MPRDHHRVLLHPKGFISQTVLPLWSFGPQSVPRAPEAQGGARRTFLRLLHLSLLLNIQGRTDIQAGMDFPVGNIATLPSARTCRVGSSGIERLPLFSCS